jgi:type 1 glutamine amidotransferase
MERIRTLLAHQLLLVLLVFLPPFAGNLANASPAKVRVLVVTGGHGFETNAFFQVFKDNPDITYQAVEHPNALALFKAEPARQYDVIVMYDFNQTITDEAKGEFIARLKEGKGLVVLHHAFAAYPQWPEYWKIIGGRYYLEKTVVDGLEKKRSAYKHGMHFTIHVADPNHPVTRGVKDYEIHDETYKWFDVAEECHPLLTTDEPESNKVIAWAKTYEKARVFYMQSGHDHFAYENPSFQRVLRQAIRWAARKD